MAKGNQIIQMYSNLTQDAAAAIDIPDDGILLRVSWSLFVAGAIADADAGRAQLSFGSVSAFTSNDARQVISNIGIQTELAGVAANVYDASKMREVSFGESGIEVFAGERIYIHTVGTGNGTVRYVYADLLFNFKAGPSRRR